MVQHDDLFSGSAQATRSVRDFVAGKHDAIRGGRLLAGRFRAFCPDVYRFMADPMKWVSIEANAQV